MQMKYLDSFNVISSFSLNGKTIYYFNIEKLEDIGLGKIRKFPFSIKILLEAVLRQIDNRTITTEDVELILKWTPTSDLKKEIPFIPNRIILQDFTGVPAVVDLAAMRSAIKRLGGNPSDINPIIPADLIIDHSIQVNYFGTSNSCELNEKLEFERNIERYKLLRWAQESFSNFRVVPPGNGIIHQINLEYLATVVQEKKIGNKIYAYPDTVLGTDSHTTMINGLGVVGWGVGGIEAEAVMLGQPYYMPVPKVVGVKLFGEINENITATDIVLTITEKLRKHGVVGKFIEFYGPSLADLSLPDRVTISNMCPEYGGTIGFFPIDEKTLDYLLLSGRDSDHVRLIEKYAKLLGIFLDEDGEIPDYSEKLEIDLSSIEPCLAGPRRPQDRVPMKKIQKSFHSSLISLFGKKVSNNSEIPKTDVLDIGNSSDNLKHGSVVIAAITSCTNTSNPYVLIGAGLLAKNAVEKGLRTKPYVKTSIAPGSKVVTEYLKKSGLLKYLEQLGFYIVGYGCTTCIGNSGPLHEKIEKEIKENDLIVAAVISGNRNFEGRIHPLIKANYLASPILVIAYALAGTIDIDLTTQPLGFDKNNNPVYLNEIWPSKTEIQRIVDNFLDNNMFKSIYSNIFKGNTLWNDLKITRSEIYSWDENSTYIREPPFFIDFNLEIPKLKDIKNARVIAMLGDSITTDHISPAGSIPSDSPAGQYLISKGVNVQDFNSFGSRRGNHEVMMRGTFGNIRLKNRLTPNKEGGWTIYFPTMTEMTIYEAAMKYKEKSIPLIIIAGKEYGTGSSRDWAAKGTQLLGIKAVIAESFERIHRSNLIGMGVLPLQFKNNENADSLGLKGEFIYDIIGINNIKPNSELTIIVKNKKDDEIKRFNVIARLDTLIEIEYYRNGGILQTVLRNILKSK